MPDKNVFEDHEERIETLETDVKSLRDWRHLVMNQESTIKLMKEEMHMQDRVLAQQSKMGEDTLKIVSGLNAAMMGERDRPGMFEQVRGLVFKETRRDKFTFLVLSILLTQLGAILVGGMIWMIQHQGK